MIQTIFVNFAEDDKTNWKGNCVTEAIVLSLPIFNASKSNSEGLSTKFIYLRGRQIVIDEIFLRLFSLNY